MNKVYTSEEVESMISEIIYQDSLEAAQLRAQQIAKQEGLVFIEP